MNNYKKGDLKKLVAELKNQGVEIDRNGSVYCIHAKNKEFGSISLKQKSNAFGCYVFEMKGYWDDGTPDWCYGDWNKIKEYIKNIILAD